MVVVGLLAHASRARHARGTRSHRAVSVGGGMTIGSSSVAEL
jgi:hypothetical protein